MPEIPAPKVPLNLVDSVTNIPELETRRIAEEDLDDDEFHAHISKPTLISRELSWLDFNSRVVALAEDTLVPLLERVRFLSIASLSLDEFFQVRVGKLKQQLEEGVAPHGTRPEAQIAAIRERVIALYERYGRVFRNVMVPELQRAGINIANWEALEAAERIYLDTFFKEQIFPALTPLAVDLTNPFPFVSNNSLNLAVVINDPKDGAELVARVKIAPLLTRFVPLPDDRGFIPIEQVISANVASLFPGMVVVAQHLFRLTRNTDFLPDEDMADDPVEAAHGVLEQRRRSPLVVRLEVDEEMPKQLIDLLIRNLAIDANDVYTITPLLDFGGLAEIVKLDEPMLKYPVWRGVTPSALSSNDPEAQPDIFRLIRDEQILVHHPYDSFERSVEAFVDVASRDPAVRAIKQTLYRTSEGASSIIGSLTRAAESGKQVAVLVELTARFDEQNNINAARILEDSGVHVIYGDQGIKTHAKLTLVVREESDGLRSYCHFGTGNYNPDTARLYEDIGLLSGDAMLGADAGELFNSLTGYSRDHQYLRLLVAPVSLRGALLTLIRREAEREQGRIIIKVNNLVDPEIIEALYAASEAGTEIDLITRSMCCLRPGVKGLSENIRVRSLVGRYLEHSRIFWFGREQHDSDVYISSADLMPRNLDRRIEVAVPVRSVTLLERLEQILTLDLRDDTLAWELDSDGAWHRVLGQSGIDAQASLQQLALQRAAKRP